ncbi:hypothetical protein P170DRAFT_426661 [Aspergillus steynii IBT 23096]|uniref:Uncharacterized protein n=1 Tax=Aspergillus steynii IBT 23096 TaxID=1392250 RepID=A0A2I2GA91_9EURO|nr:uncharacterized protein P170DRAFT_426661 [Aspergillus steynii IBT 23096]PLB49795.1 hypothetical protein P170DRAFT_426661 [Aspergillus steynii IBT 23096]
MASKNQSSIFFVSVGIGPMELSNLMDRYELAHKRLSENHSYDVYHTAPERDGFALVFKVSVVMENPIHEFREVARLEAMKLLNTCLNPKAEDNLFVGLQPFSHPTFNRATRQPYAAGYVAPMQLTQQEIRDEAQDKRDHDEYQFVNVEDMVAEPGDEQVLYCQIEHH